MATEAPNVGTNTEPATAVDVVAAAVDAPVDAGTTAAPLGTADGDTDGSKQSATVPLAAPAGTALTVKTRQLTNPLNAFLAASTPRPNLADATEEEDERMSELNLPTAPKTLDRTGQRTYLTACKTLETVPITFFYRNLVSETVDMTHRGIGPRGAQAMAECLAVCPLSRRAAVDTVLQSSTRRLFTSTWRTTGSMTRAEWPWASFSLRTSPSPIW